MEAMPGPGEVHEQFNEEAYMGKRMMAFVLAWVATYVLAVTAATQSVLGFLEELGRQISMGDRVSAIAHDIAGMVLSYGALILVALLIAFGVVALIVKRATHLRVAGYVIGGFVAIIAIHMGLRLAFDMNPVWATSTPLGLILQGLAGAVGGYMFTRVNPVAAA